MVTATRCSSDCGTCQFKRIYAKAKVAREVSRTWRGAVGVSLATANDHARGPETKSFRLKLDARAYQIPTLPRHNARRT